MFRLTILLLVLSLLFTVVQNSFPHKCGPVCQVYCRHGNELDSNGCPLCKCKKAPNKSIGPCKDGQPPLEGYYCGWGPNRQDCPSTYTCVISVDDGYAVCCPPHQEPIL